jgi:hypothetical protein
MAKHEERPSARLEIAVESLHDDIKLLAEAVATMHQAMDRRFQEMYDYIHELTAPLTLITQQHSAVIHHHNLGVELR